MTSGPILSSPSLCCHVQEELAQTEERLQSKRSQLEDLVVQVCGCLCPPDFLSVCLFVRLSVSLPVCPLFVHVVLYQLHFYLMPSLKVLYSYLTLISTTLAVKQNSN